MTVVGQVFNLPGRMDPAPQGARPLVHCLDVPEGCVIEKVNIWGTKQVQEMVRPY
jgi:hypothetical protein